MKAEKALDFHGKFIISDASGTRLGAVKKAFKSSLFRSTWEVLDSNDQSAVTVREKSQALAIFRRVWEFIPFLGDIPFLVKYHFMFTDMTGAPVGSYVKTTLLRDHYRLEVEDRLVSELGWQTLVTQAVLLDALQGR